MQVPPEMTAAKDALAALLTEMPGVLGIDIGLQEQQGELTDDLAVRIIVGLDDDVPPDVSALMAAALVPVVVIRRDLSPLVDNSFFRPIQGGISINAEHGVASAGGGTLGGCARDDLNGGALCGVSCAHVLAESDFFPVLVGDAVFQPESSAPASRQIGTLLRADADVDGAIFAFSIDASDVLDTSIVGVGVHGGLASKGPEIGDQVLKRGRTTRLTHGTVSGVGLTIFGSTSTPGRFEIFRRIDEPVFCDHGDSGSFIINDRAEVVGLLVQGGLHPTTGVAQGFFSGIAMDMAAVCARLSISL